VGLLLVSVWLGWRERTAQKTATELAAATKKDQAFSAALRNTFTFEEAAEPARLADLRTRAEKGDATAQYALGLAYYWSDGVEQDYAQAAKWFRKAGD